MIWLEPYIVIGIVKITLAGIKSTGIFFRGGLGSCSARLEEVVIGRLEAWNLEIQASGML